MVGSNKEDALRDREIAINKMKNKDFVGAQKIVLKAQKLFPELENVSQLLTICSVHCAAEIRVNGEMDFYRVLQVEEGADQALIKKQYHKLAFLLHPDKNCFEGAEAAFKLIGEAHSVVSDTAKRYDYDLKRTGFRKVPKPAKQQPSERTDSHKQSMPGVGETFWTICSNCQLQRQYYSYMLNKMVPCVNCKRNFCAVKLNQQPKATSSSVPKSSHVRDTPNRQGQVPKPAKQQPSERTDSHKQSMPGFGETFWTICSNCQVQCPYYSYMLNKMVPCVNCKRNFCAVKLNQQPKATSSSVPKSPHVYDTPNRQGQPVKSSSAGRGGSSGTQSSVKRKMYADDNVCLDTDTNKRSMKSNFPSDVNMSCKKVCDNGITKAGTQSEPPHVSGANVGTQQKPKVADISDHQVNIKENATETDQEYIMVEAQTFSETKPSYSERVSLPDPDIFDFEKIRDINVFEVGQIWALYDILDCMPRYYARINHFDASSFKIHLTWLEYVAMDEDEENWTVQELPTACGNFRLGKGTDISEDKEMFSHIASWTKGKKRNSYVIYPNKGEVWALYKGWSMDWSSDADNHRVTEYEVVEVVSSMSANGGATVIPLVRIEGFVSLFATAKDRSPFVIPSSELLRFSHNIPFYRTQGNEKVGVPRGFLELDNACLPADQDAAFSSVTLDSYMSLSKTESCTPVNVTTENKSCRMDLGDDEIVQKDNHPDEHIGRPMSKDNPKDMCPEQNSPLKKAAGDANEFSDCSHQVSLSPYKYSYPDSDFHNFDESSSCEKFERGQVWALYNDIDKFPNFYAYIKKVREEPFRVEVIWLEACPKQDQEKQWLKQGIPISCGTFIIRKWTDKYDTRNTFSHRVYFRKTSKKRLVEILPQVGDIWAVYMNWAPDWVPCSVDDCEFAICEVVEYTEASTKLTFLAQVSGYISVFKPDKKRGVLEVPAGEKLRFSHQIPYFRLTEEGGGRLRGFYDLHLASVPDAFLCGET